MLYVRYTDPPTHIIGEQVRICRAIVDEGREPVNEFDYAKLSDHDKERTPLKIIRPQRITLTDEQCRSMRPEGVNDIALACDRSPGDVVAMTAVVRELHKAYPGKFRTVIQTWFPELWENNPYITPESEIVQPKLILWDWKDTKQTDPHCHFVQCWRDDLQRKLGVPIPMSNICGDIHLTDAEKRWPDDLLGNGPRPFAIINSGTKPSGAIKNWGRDNYQSVVDHFAGKIEFVQIGKASEHHHQSLGGVADLLDRTSVRDLCRLVYWADVVLCPVTFLMHLSAAMPLRNGSIRPCVVLAGGREPNHTVAYEGHTVLGTVGSLPCCSTGACWKMYMAGEGGSDAQQCVAPVKNGGEFVGKCFSLIKPGRVCDAIESYLSDGIPVSVNPEVLSCRLPKTSHSPSPAP